MYLHLANNNIIRSGGLTVGLEHGHSMARTPRQGELLQHCLMALCATGAFGEGWRRQKGRSCYLIEYYDVVIGIKPDRIREHHDFSA